MLYCVDTWYFLGLFAHEPKAERILTGIKDGKDAMVIPLTVFAEATKKLLQQGARQDKVDEFFEIVESSEKIKIVIPDKIIAREAAHVSLTYGLSMLDAFVAATTKFSTADILLSGDADYAPLIKKKYLKVQSW